MTKEWVDKKNKELQYEFLGRREFIKNAIKNTQYIHGDEKDDLLQEIDKIDRWTVFIIKTKLETLSWCFVNCKNHTEEEYQNFRQWIDSLDLDWFTSYDTYESFYDTYLDSELMEFDGDIIITDPCYIINKNSHRDDWDKCNCGDNMEVLGFHNYMVRDTIYGDWDCTTFNSDTGEEIGNFCADAGLVAVFSLDEVLKYNPNFNYQKWTTTWIKNFKGTVQFVVDYTENVYDDTTDYHKKGETWIDASVKVVGHGIDKTTGSPINFIGEQTGF